MQDTGDAIGLSVVLQVAVVELPFMKDAFSTTPLSLGDCVALSSVVLWADELRKLVARRRASRPALEPAVA